MAGLAAVELTGALVAALAVAPVTALGATLSVPAVAAALAPAAVGASVLVGVAVVAFAGAFGMSLCGCGTFCDVDIDGAGAPHLVQNFSSSASLCPHLLQNFIVSLFPVSHTPTLQYICYDFQCRNVVSLSASWEFKSRLLWRSQ
ncbi:hypothetical protein OZX73_00715 [Bifidobacterium sp. ESL0775]|uniref:hypothetical protein n=1 Tax=Bifidobacterium sp. ESL0775 TaxID=2983230 RepID=UPI0023F763C6|nr:hypothetical protein [Bifidobacterium sp. ESL0775]WEV69453.1 hypothetical protein OZX73_00715 [Bifidobacterium sp. ESL0775]